MAWGGGDDRLTAPPHSCDTGGDCECLCSAIATYADECARHRRHVRWRSQELCRECVPLNPAYSLPLGRCFSCPSSWLVSHSSSNVTWVLTLLLDTFLNGTKRENGGCTGLGLSSSFGSIMVEVSSMHPVLPLGEAV